MMRFFLKSTLYLPFLALLPQAACDEDSTGPGDNGVPVTLGLALDIRYPTITAGPTGRIYTIRPNDLDTRRLDARNSDGSLLWTVVFPECTDECSRVPVVDAAGNVYMATGQGLMSWNGTTAALRWTAAGIRLGSLALGSNSRVYASNASLRANQPVYAFDRATGVVAWAATIPDGGVTSVLLDESRGTLYALTRGKAVALDAQTGAIKFTAKPLLGIRCFSGAGSIASDGTLYVSCDNDMSSELSAYSPIGDAKWLRNLGPYSGTTDPIIDASGVIYVANPGSVTALTPNNEIIWRLDGLYRNNVGPVIDSEKNVYIFAELKDLSGRHLYVVKDGKIAEDKGLVTADGGGALLLAADGRGYYNSNGSLVYFMSAGADAAAQWPQTGRDGSRTFRK